MLIYAVAGALLLAEVDAPANDFKFSAFLNGWGNLVDLVRLVDALESSDNRRPSGLLKHKVRQVFKEAWNQLSGNMG